MDEDGTRSEECSFKLDDAVLSQVDDIYNRRFQQWSAKCSGDEGNAYLQECLKEYQVS